MASRGMRLGASALALALLVAPWPLRAKTEVPPLLNRPECGSFFSGTKAEPKSTLRVATFNVLHGLEQTAAYPTHSTLDARLELAVQEIVDEGIDLLGMQEVSKTKGARGHRSGSVAKRMARRLAQITGQAWHWCWVLSNPHFPPEPDIAVGGGGPLSDVIAANASSRYDSFKEGAAVLSRYPIKLAESRRLPLRFPAEYVLCPPEEIPDCNLTTIFDHRIALWARVATPGGPTDIIATHLVHDLTPLSDVSTFEQAAALLAFSDEKALQHGEPSRRFITCDCNVQTSDFPPVVQFITDNGWTDTYATQNPSSRCAPPADRSACTSDQDILARASTTTERIDYVFARGGTCALTLGRSRKFADEPSRVPGHRYLWPSDHHALWTDVAAGC